VVYDIKQDRSDAACAIVSFLQKIFIVHVVVPNLETNQEARDNILTEHNNMVKTEEFL